MSQLSARVTGDPPVIEVLDGDRTLLRGAVAFQPTSAVGERRWRGGPSQWKLGPGNQEPPPDHGWQSPGCAIATRAVTAGLEVAVTVAAEAAEVEAVRCSFAAGAGERWLGFGERSDHAVRSEGVVEHYVGEGPWQEWEYPFLGSTVPEWGVRQRLDATYFPVPWILSTAGYGVAIADDHVSYARLRPGGRAEWSVEVEAASLRFVVVPGPTPLAALRRYTEAVGRQARPEPWWFGPWWQTGHDNHVPIDEERRQLGVLRAAGAPVSAAETHCRYLPVGEHRGHEASEQARVEHLHGAGLAVLSYLNPLVSVDYSEAFGPASDGGALLRTSSGATYTFEAYAGGREPPVTRETHYDFSAEGGGRHWEVVAQAVVDAGYDGWMEDFGEYTPLDAHVVDTGGPVGPAGHNRYPTDYHRAAAAVTARLEEEIGRRLARFVRSGWTGTAAVAPIVWGGDPTTSWGFDGLASAVVEGLSAGASGVAMWGSDIGGFVSSVELLTPELLIRWLQFGACCPVMRTKSAGIQGPDVVRPQIWDDDVLPHWVRWAAWHTQLLPYLAAAHQEYRESGRPLMVAPALADPDDADGLDLEDQYLLGPDLLVAPVLTADARTRDLCLPAGEWVDLWRAVRFDPATRALTLVGGARSLVGPGPTTVPAPLDEIPVLVRAGAVLPLLPADVDSLSPYRGAGVVSLADRHHERRLLCFPVPGRWEGRLDEDAPAASTVTAGDAGPVWRLDLPPVPGRTWSVRADLSLLPPSAALLVAGAEDGWTWDPGSHLLAAEVRGPALVVSAAPEPGRPSLP